MGKQKTYSHFKFDDLENLNLSVQLERLFEKVKKLDPSDWLLLTLRKGEGIPRLTEKSKSELFVSPILVELRDRNPETFTFFSGYNFDVDKEKGLKGHCDFLISTNYKSPFIEAPVLAIVEAKRDDIEMGVPQCIAEMYAAQIFNERKKKAIKTIFGAVTNGTSWLFLKLEEKIVLQDTTEYSTQNLPELLGVLQTIIDFYKK